ncbi:lamin tail domain-containing protein [Candidatus Uhrbacteria bacterium]|nr:lamin tail domain-containing protein [Candidatus Uhrbacteria bacterium]
MKIILFLVLASFPLTVLAQSATGLPSPIIITEVQIEGSTATDEFVEIYNSGDAPVNLKGWRLSKKTATGNENNLLTDFPDLTLASGSFLTIGSAPGTDLKYSTQQSLSDNNTAILYSDSGKTVADLVGWGDTSIFQGQAAMSPEKAQSLQRKFDAGKFAVTGNNGADFLMASPTLKSATLPPVSQPSPTPAPSPASAPASGGGGSYFPPALIAYLKEKAKPDVIFNELLPNPAGPDDRDEFIELKNLGNTLVDLTFWKIKSSQGEFTFEPEKWRQPYLSAGQIFLLKRTDLNLALGNKKESLKLLDAGGEMMDQVKYADAEEETGYMWDAANSHWRWSSSLTPGQENIYKPATRPPVANIVVSGESLDEPVGLDASDSFDPDGDPLSYMWLIKMPKGGTIKKAGQLISFEPTVSGSYKISLKVIDATGKNNITQATWKPRAPDDFVEEDGQVEASAVPASKTVVATSSPKTKKTTKSAAKTVAQNTVTPITPKITTPSPPNSGSLPQKSRWWILPSIYVALAVFLFVGWAAQKRL